MFRQSHDVEKIFSQIKAGYGASDQALIQRAFEVAQKAHHGQKRESGEAYILHPLYTALALAQMKMDAQTVAAAILHDVVDDTPLTQKEVEKEFGKEIGFLVQGTTKLGRLKYRGRKRQAENLRKMLVAIAEDIRVIFIKLADRLHNMQTLGALSEEKQKRISLETIEIYAPLALRLGMAEIGKQLEDLAFPYLYPDQYLYVLNEVQKRYPEREEYLKKIVPVLNEELKKEGIKPQEIQTRAKHYYSLWQKLQKYNMNWDSIYDLVALRIIVSGIEECYGALGAIHRNYKPLPGRIKDFIALPKPNGYQSLHTTVFSPEGKIIEVQIRTSQMHEKAEYGIAGHWAYQAAGKPKEGASIDKRLAWVGQLTSWLKETQDHSEFLDSLKYDVFKNRIFVFTPKGDVIDLPEGATLIDFAYAIHSQIGDRCQLAKINGKAAALDTELANGEVVEIITAKNKKPSADWLKFAKTSHARSYIKKWLKSQR